MDRFGDNGGAGGRKPMGKSNYCRKEEDLETLWKESSSTGINFSKYEKIAVNVEGENQTKPIQTFDEAGFAPLLMRNIKRAKYETPTPVQKHGISILMAGRDLMACAQTGSGKTAAFLFPVINNLMARKSESKDGMAVTPQMLVMAPTRELIIQIYDEARKFCGGTGLTCGVAYGGTSDKKQLFALSRGCNILAATPGRLLDFLKRGEISFKNVQFLVLDEADKMLDMGFLPNIRECVKHHTMSTRNRQTAMFSAPFPSQIQKIASEFLDNYLFLQVGIVGGACTDVRQTFQDVTRMNKMDKNEMLIAMLQKQMQQHRKDKTLVFVEQKKHADVLAMVLCQDNIPATTIHGDRAQEEREMALNDFKSGSKPILVATAVAARGLDGRQGHHSRGQLSDAQGSGRVCSQVGSDYHIFTRANQLQNFFL